MIMTTRKNITTLLWAAVCSLALAATPTLAEAGKGGSASRIQNAVNTGSPDAIIAEIERAERLICGACVEPMMALLDDERYEVREAAAWWFSRRPAQKAELHDRSIADLHGSDSIRARNAADILGAFRHPQAIEPLAMAAQRADLAPEARLHAVRALGHIGHRDANVALAAAMGDTDAAVRLAAVNAWLEIRRQAGAAAVVPLIGDADQQVRRAAVSVAGNLREASARVALEERVVSDPDPVVRRNAAWALGRIGDSAARSALQAATADESSLVRRTAQVALGQLR
jgi:HEAT repeat protein